MRLSLIFSILGMMTMLFGGLMMFPFFIDWLRQNESSACVFFYSGFGCIFTGACLVYFSKRPWERHLLPKEKFLITSSLWLCATFIGAIPLFFSAPFHSFTDAFFETMSGLTTTGATILQNIEISSEGVLLWRALMQWIGGIGIVIFAISVMPFLRIGGLQLFATENSDKSEKGSPFLSTKIKGILGLYILISCICYIALYIAGMSWFDALVHMMSCVSTGGFSNYNNSIAHFQNPTIDWILIFFMTLCSLPFVFLLSIVFGKWKKTKDETQAKIFLTFIAFISLAISIYLWTTGYFNNFSTAIRNTTFSIVSIVSTTGYVLQDYTLWGSFCIAFFFFYLWVGGCRGSSSGGIKAFRFIIIFEVLNKHLQTMILPHAVIVPRYNNKPVTDDIINSVMVFFSAFVLIIILGTLGVTMTGVDFVTALSGTMAAISNVGPGIGTTIGPDKTFALLPPMAKWILSFVMMLGRLEFMTIFVFIFPSVWYKK